MTARRPPSLRDPENYGQRLANGLRAMSKGTDGGRVLNAAPVTALADAEAEDTESDVVTVTVAFAHDRLPTSGTLAAAATTMTLTASPLTDSLHLYLNGLELDEGTDYTLSGRTVTILSPAGTATGDVLDARYAYGGVIDPLVPWNATGWRYLTTTRTDSTSYASPAFDDSAWATGQAAFGSNYADYGLHTTWAVDTRIWIRRTIGTIAGDTVTITGRVDNDVDVYWNGTLLYSATFPDATTLWSTTATATGSDVLAIRATDDAPHTTDGCFIDVQVTQAP